MQTLPLFHTDVDCDEKHEFIALSRISRINFDVSSLFRQLGISSKNSRIQPIKVHNAGQNFHDWLVLEVRSLLQLLLFGNNTLLHIKRSRARFHMDTCHAEPDLVIRPAAIRLDFWRCRIAFRKQIKDPNNIYGTRSLIQDIPRKCLNRTQTKFKQNNTSVAGL